MTGKQERCETGYRHIWEPRGLDIEDGELVSTYRCEPCGQERAEKY